MIHTKESLLFNNSVCLNFLTGKVKIQSSMTLQKTNSVQHVPVSRVKKPSKTLVLDKRTAILQAMAHAVIENEERLLASGHHFPSYRPLHEASCVIVYESCPTLH